MKKISLAILIFVFASIQTTFAQSDEGNFDSPVYPPTTIKNGSLYWCEYPIDTIVRQADLIFEAKILSDSVFLYGNAIIETYHRVLVTKQFKGDFKSDTIIAVTGGGTMLLDGAWQGNPQFAKKGDEALFFVSREYNAQYKINNPDLYVQIYGNGCGFVNVCDKKDIEERVYKPLENKIGHPYVEIHPNTCKDSKTQTSPK